MIELWNDQISVKISKAGAELQSLVKKDINLAYMWDGDPAFWAKHSPVLFPIVGTLKNNEYQFAGKSYHLGRHGFARDLEFQVYEHGETSASFRLDSDAKTFENYPFIFQFTIHYSLHDNELSVEYLVSNKGDGDMFFSLGAHPAFKLPMVPELKYDDYYLEFSDLETAPRWPISKDGLIETQPENFLENTNRLNLKKDLFAKDAIVLKGIRSESILLKSDKSSHGLEFSLPGFPYLGLWAAPQADFLCIEPWCGIADGVDSSQQLTEKEGIIDLKPGTEFSRTWKVKVF
ncbi:MAG: aldose 1-epimerase family protein [Chitinophagaceae bacterium]